MKNDFVRNSYKSRGSQGFDISISHNMSDMNSRVAGEKPLFSPFISLTVDEAFEACQPGMKSFFDFLNSGTYKWHNHKLFRSFITSMHGVQQLTGSDGECYKVVAVITYKQIARLLYLSRPPRILFYDGEQIDSQRLRDLKMREAYALLEFLLASHKTKQAGILGNLVSPDLLQKLFTIHMRAAMQLKEITDEASHVRIIGLEPSEYEGSSHDPDTDEESEEEECDEDEEEDSESEEELNLLDYYYRRKAPTPAKTLPVSSKIQPEVSEEKISHATSSETELVQDRPSTTDVEKAGIVVVPDTASQILSENGNSNASSVNKSQPALSDMKNNVPAHAETDLMRDTHSSTSKDERRNTEIPKDINQKLSPESQDNATKRQNIASTDNVKDRSEPKEGDKNEDTGVVEKQCKPSARKGIEQSPLEKVQRQSNEKGCSSINGVVCDPAISPIRDAQLNSPNQCNDTSVRCVENGAPYDADENITPGLREGQEECNLSAMNIGDPLNPYADPAALNLDVNKTTLELVAEMQDEISALRAKNEKIVANLRHKKSLLEQSSISNKHLQEELSSQERCLDARIASLRSGIENVTASRDNLKNKLRIEKELLTQARLDNEKLQRQLKQSEKARTMERELLDLYRELGNHTGYHTWGKRIRILEAQLSEQQNSQGE